MTDVKEKKKKIKKKVIPKINGKYIDGDEIRVFGYCRVSSDDQAEEGISIEMQEDMIKDFCTKKGYKLVDIFKDLAVMGSSELNERKEMNSLLFQLDQGKAHGLVALRLDRICRGLNIYANFSTDLKNKGLFLMLITDSIDTSTINGRAHANLMASFAELEGERIKERTNEAIAYRRKTNKVIGACPMGRRRKVIDGVETDTLEEHPEEMKTISIARELRTMLIPRFGKKAQEKNEKRIMPYSMICQKLVEMGRKNKDGRVKWHPSNVRTMCLGKNGVEAIKKKDKQ